MINELYYLSEAICNAGIQTSPWHRKYKPLPNIKPDAPCVRILVSDGNVEKISNIDRELGAYLRKYGSNQGTYPCMNLAPLYRITDESVKKKLSNLQSDGLTKDTLEFIKKLCTETSNNWGSKFKNKYRISMKNIPDELEGLVGNYTPLQVLLKETRLFLDPQYLHQKMTASVFSMLENSENINLALQVLFYFSNADKQAADDFGTLSVAFDTYELIQMGIPAISTKFVDALNEVLLKTDPTSEDIELNSVDAFGISFHPIEEPMPEVKLAGGFDVKLRTMFKEQHCQMRYARIENASYPISPKIRRELQSALNWIGNAEHKNITWINTDKNEILFVYPMQLPQVKFSYTKMFKRPDSRDKSFELQAKQFLTELSHTKKESTDSHADRIQIFILRKIDKARTKVIYTRLTDPHELEKCSEVWTIGCTKNLPYFAFGQPDVLFPLDTADILNRFWKQNGELATDKYKPVPKYHGMELLMEKNHPLTSDLQLLSRQAMTLSVFLGNKLAVHDTNHLIWDKIKDMLALMGFILYRSGIRKDIYMENLPYLYGQLLKVSDELHALYCCVIRNNNLPTQLVGSSLYQAAIETPIRTLTLLGQRMNPYIAWAKIYRTKNITDSGVESWRAGWLLSLYETIASKLYAIWQPEHRFNDEEKAQFFIGYLAAYPKKETTSFQSDSNKNIDEENKNA